MDDGEENKIKDECFVDRRFSLKIHKKNRAVTRPNRIRRSFDLAAVEKADHRTLRASSVINIPSLQSVLFFHYLFIFFFFKFGSSARKIAPTKKKRKFLVKRQFLTKGSLVVTGYTHF